MSHYYSSGDLITLFIYDEEDDIRSYTAWWKSMNIDDKTGALVTKSFSQPVNHPAATMCYTERSDFEEYKRILSTRKIRPYTRDCLWEELNETNWEEWLINNHLV